MSQQVAAEEFDVNTKAPEDKLEAIRLKADEGVALRKKVDELEGDLKAAKAALHELSTKTLPDMMTEVGLESFTREGWEIKLALLVSGTLPKDEEKRKAAIDWLVEHDASSLIKTEVGVEFGRDSYDDAVKLYKALAKKGLGPNLQSGVHPQTLCAFARERLESGEPIDLEVLGLFSCKAAKFEDTAAKKKSKGKKS